MIRPRNDTLLRALRREPTDYAPIWLMRQAGRYLPEYNATRARAGSFMQLCANPALATEVTLQPLARYPLDAAILFSDILTVPDAMGLGLSFTEGEGPRFERPLADETAIARLERPIRTVYITSSTRWPRSSARSTARTVARLPPEARSPSPVTDRRCGSVDFTRTRRCCLRAADLLHRVLAINADAITTT